MSDTNSFINDLVDDFNKVQELILPDEPTVAQSISVHLTKVLILTCASHYEQVLQNAYTSYAECQSAVYGDKPHGFDNDKRDKSVYQKFQFGRIETAEDLNQYLLTPIFSKCSQRLHGCTFG